MVLEVIKSMQPTKAINVVLFTIQYSYYYNLQEVEDQRGE